jgi:hypothetical protein
MKRPWVLQDYYKQKLIGIYSTKRKVMKAAREFCLCFCPEVADKFEVTEDGKEIIWGNGNDFCIHAEPWLVDKALVDGRWQQI